VITVLRQSVQAFAQAAYVKASNNGVDDNFGFSVSLSGDTLAVGAQREDSNAKGVNGDQASNGATNSGAVYVFNRANGVWSQQAYLKASNASVADFFGRSISLSGDTLAVGAHGEDSKLSSDQANNSANSAGAVYVFSRENGVWTQKAYLKASNVGANDYFGYSVSLSGDTLAVGAYQEDSDSTGVNGDQTSNGANNSGAVYVFSRADGVWSQQAYLKASNPDANDYFGWSVSVSGDTLAVGAYQEDSAATGVNGDQADNSVRNSGAVYVFSQADGEWSQQAYLKASNPDISDNFGGSVSLFGDTLAVGAIYEDSAATGVNGHQTNNSAGESGAVYVFSRSNGVWSQQAYLKASNTETEDLFGIDVSLSGDILAVGAYQEDSATNGVNGDQTDNSAQYAGAVYVFSRENGVWSQQDYLKASNAEADDYFGHSVSLSGHTLAVGVPLEDSAATGVNGDQADNSAANAGAVYLLQ
jgi:hypothetical protein